jgi:hypothetical protein
MKIRCDWILGDMQCNRAAVYFWWRPNNNNLHIAGCKKCSDENMHTPELKSVGWKEVSKEEYIIWEIMES